MQYLLEKRVIKRKGCWGWKGILTKWGYGDMSIGGRNNAKHHNAHRISWMIYKGDIPKGLFVLHRCDVRVCCNPSHLFLGTPKDNMHDMIKKKRSNFLKGDDCPWSKVNSTIVLDILDMLKQGINTKDIAQKYDIKLSMISDIKTGHRWGHIGDRTSIKVKPYKIVLNEDKVREIKKEYAQGARVCDLVKKYNLNRGTLDDIKHNRTWKHVTI